MSTFFETPLLFWHVFIFSFLICTGVGAFIQCWFLIHFCDVKSRKSYYIVYLLISYASYLVSISIPIQIPPMLDTLIGVGILFVFSHKLLKQNHIQSAITATLTMAITTLVESTILLLESFSVKATTMTQTIPLITGFLFPVISFIIFKFFVRRYSIKSRYQSKHLLAFSLPIFFISVMLRTVNYIRYTLTTGGMILQFDKIQTYEAIILTIIAFLCISTVLFSYEKTIAQVDSDNQKALLYAQIAAQENYVAEVKQKYETTKAFRHDFKNHMLALRGLIKSDDTEKAASYMERFEQTYQDMTFSIDTGNSVLNTLFGEKLSYAEQMGIHVKCDISIPKNVKVDDFDLCAIFANAIDNAIKACSGIKNGEKSIDILAKPNKNFFLIDMLNNYQVENVVKGSGIGLTTIEIIAKKYDGAVEISETNNLFRISVILPFDP